jgi:DNA-binding beta-propeller fold protein YncE
MYGIITLHTIDFSKVSGGLNSVAVHKGLLAVALEGINKQDNGKIAVLNTATLAEIKSVTVGALTAMVTFNPDGKFIISANEGELNDAYMVDPAVSVSIIDISKNNSIKTLNFSAYES